MHLKIFRIWLLVVAGFMGGCEATRVETHMDTSKLENLQKAGLTPPLLQMKSCAKIEYPSESRRVGEEGKVMALAYTDNTGKILQVRIQKSSGFSRLDSATTAWLSTCKFSPAIKDGKPIAMWAAVAYVWKVED